VVKESQEGPEHMDVHATCPALDSLLRAARTGRVGMRHSDDSMKRKRNKLPSWGVNFG